jgi:pyruvyl transferase EpsO
MRKWQGIDNPLRHVVSNYALWKIYRDDLVNRAVKSFQPYETIDTDRLHGMILGSLMGKQVVFGDGNYGKLHRYAKAWLSESPQLKSGMVTTASSVAG